ncbi:MAG TPA: hypothetical protein DCL15_20145, partial [Chloroflexi bacterium]|nr:hypothetical protein [Chloroflexota bacterium]
MLNGAVTNIASASAGGVTSPPDSETVTAVHSMVEGVVYPAFHQSLTERDSGVLQVEGVKRLPTVKQPRVIPSHHNGGVS